jgi:hypothetical protein
MRSPIRWPFADCCAPAASGASTRLTRTTASPISRMLPGSLAERHDAHQRPGQTSCYGRPSNMTILSRFASSRIGSTSWYSGESYQARAFSMLGNSSITIRVGRQSPSRQSMLLVAATSFPSNALTEANALSRYHPFAPDERKQHRKIRKQPLTVSLDASRDQRRMGHLGRDGWRESSRPGVAPGSRCNTARRLVRTFRRTFPLWRIAREDWRTKHPSAKPVASIRLRVVVIYANDTAKDRNG